DLFGEWFVQAGLSFNRFQNRQQFGALDLRPIDTNGKLRIDAERSVSDKLHLNLGTEVERSANRFRGEVPLDFNNIEPGAPTQTLDEAYPTTRTGAYAEVEWQPTRRLVTTLGARADHYALSSEVVVDPRLSLLYALTKQTELRLAWGIYHQFPEAYDFNAATGNPDLKAQQAQHFILGLNHEESLGQFRVEAYYKPYRRLVLEDPMLHLTNRGTGMARGVDVFLRYGEFLRTRVYGRLAYSLLDAERRQARHRGEDVVLDRKSVV